MSTPRDPSYVGALTAERFGVEVAAGRRFDAAQTVLLEKMMARVKRELRVSDARLCEAFAAVELGGRSAVVVCEPAAPGVPSLFVEGGVAVRYNGRVSDDLRTCLKIVHRYLRVLPGDAHWTSRADDASAPARDAPASVEPNPDPTPTPTGATTRRTLPMMVLNGALAHLPHDPAVRRVAEVLWRPCPTIKLGHACNVDCLYCCAGSDGPKLESEDELRSLVATIRRAGFRGIGYMGGEPTVHPGFHDLVRHAASLGFEAHVLVTNGLRLADAGFTARTLAAGVNVVILSLDAFDPAVQEHLFGGRVGYDKALEGLHRLLAAPGVDVVLAAVVTAENARLLPAYMDEVARLQRRYGKPIGVLLHALQQPARRGPEQDALHLDLADAARLVADALARAREGGVAVLVFSIPTCLLPGFEHNVVDLYAAEWEIDLDTGVAGRSQRRGAETYWSFCATCPHVRCCPGVLTQYADERLRALVASRRGAPATPVRRNPS
jgi:pyruvate-formate lyase-activating enzyme